MRYYEEDITFELTQEETARLFEPFVYHDGMTMVQYKRRDRLLRHNIQEWFEGTIGKEHEAWGYQVLDSDDQTCEVWFKDRKSAMIFKLMAHNDQ